MMTKRVLCYAHGRPNAWEALCLDFDIAVQGASFDEVKALLDEAIRTYVEDACAESPETARQLLNRRAPLWLRAKLVASFLLHMAFRRDGAREYQAGFDLPCPA